MRAIRMFADVRINDLVVYSDGARSVVCEVLSSREGDGGWLTVKDNKSGLVHDIWWSGAASYSVFPMPGRGLWVGGRWVVG